MGAAASASPDLDPATKAETVAYLTAEFEWRLAQAAEHAEHDATLARLGARGFHGFAKCLGTLSGLQQEHLFGGGGGGGSITVGSDRSWGGGGPYFWAYDGPAGVQSWPLNHELMQRQSPIDIVTAHAVVVADDVDGFSSGGGGGGGGDSSGAARGEAVLVAYEWPPAPAAVIHNGHTVVVQWGDGGGAGNDAGVVGGGAGAAHLTLSGTAFCLRQFHFHCPAEHTVDGVRYPMEMQLVHTSPAGAVAIVSLLFKHGAECAFFEQFWYKLPWAAVAQTRDVEGAGAGANCLGAPLETLGVLDPSSLRLPALLEDGFWSYSGSLTTPPLSEGVAWLLPTTPLEASASQIAAMRALVGGERLVRAPLGGNARPAQPLHGRRVVLGGREAAAANALAVAKQSGLSFLQTEEERLVASIQESLGSISAF